MGAGHLSVLFALTMYEQFQRRSSPISLPNCQNGICSVDRTQFRRTRGTPYGSGFFSRSIPISESHPDFHIRIWSSSKPNESPSSDSVRNVRTLDERSNAKGGIAAGVTDRRYLLRWFAGFCSQATE